MLCSVKAIKKKKKYVCIFKKKFLEIFFPFRLLNWKQSLPFLKEQSFCFAVKMLEFIALVKFWFSVC